MSNIDPTQDGKTHINIYSKGKHLSADFSPTSHTQSLFFLKVHSNHSKVIGTT
ncbi:MAG: hypothetical protein IM536_10975 [Pseudanabaena sp. M34BS1SP1A06MG]|nr:hypothetical protein [Pseudanabaena sp. M34BS1SP1A06MG]